MYGIGWLPLGGYVKIAGMIDESFDKELSNKIYKDFKLFFIIIILISFI